MDLKIYFSSYIIIWAFLYYCNFISFNPLYWLYIAVIVAIIINSFLAYYNASIKDIILFSLLNSPKLLFIILLNNNNPFQGFIFGLFWFIIYLFIINFNLYNVYYTNTITAIINNKFF